MRCKSLTQALKTTHLPTPLLYVIYEWHLWPQSLFCFLLFEPGKLRILLPVGVKILTPRDFKHITIISMITLAIVTITYPCQWFVAEYLSATHYDHVYQKKAWTNFNVIFDIMFHWNERTFLCDINIHDAFPFCCVLLFRSMGDINFKKINKLY